MNRIVLLCLYSTMIIITGCANTANAESQPHVILVVLAHPDDETFFGPVLSRYAREGAKIYLALANRGDKGVRPFAGTKPGDELANLRRSEVECSCRQLKIEPPVDFGVGDGETGALTLPVLDQNIQIVVRNVEKMVQELKPDVILTWGPEGGYGHIDHRLASSAATQVVQSMHTPPHLFYLGFTTEQARIINENDSGPWHGGSGWHPTDPTFLPVRISFTQNDEQAFHRALECHKTQFSPQEMQNMEKWFGTAWNGSITFRPWFGNRKATDLFKSK
jgi:LmbE family N-acetylglucosaminyl deacetylase